MGLFNKNKDNEKNKKDEEEINSQGWDGIYFQIKKRSTR